MATITAENNNINPSGLNSQRSPPEEIVSKDENLTAAAISDLLYYEMCSTDEKQENINWYYAEAAKYARSGSSAGNFDGKNTKYKPEFLLVSKHFSPKLRANRLVVDSSKESLHCVVEDAVFEIFRARHPRIFYRYIEAKRLRWRFV